MAGRSQRVIKDLASGYALGAVQEDEGGVQVEVRPGPRVECRRGGTFRRTPSVVEADELEIQVSFFWPVPGGQTFRVNLLEPANTPKVHGPRNNGHYRKGDYRAEPGHSVK